MAGKSSRPLAPHVQRCLGGPVAHVQAMMVPDRRLAPHVQAAVQRQIPVLQARLACPVPPGRPAVIQRSTSNPASFEITVVEGDTNRTLSGMEVKMDISGSEAFAVAGLYTKEVRNCAVLCMFSSHEGLKKLFMFHTPVYDELLTEGLRIAKAWKGVDFKSYIIGGNEEKAFTEESMSGGSWGALKIAGIKSPLAPKGSFANIEARGTQITYWIKDDQESTAVNLLDLFKK